MGGDGYNRDCASRRSVVPENPIGGRSLLLGVGLKDFFARRPLQRGEFVSLEAVVFRVRCQEHKRLLDSFIALLLRRTSLKPGVV